MDGIGPPVNGSYCEFLARKEGIAFFALQKFELAYPLS